MTLPVSLDGFLSYLAALKLFNDMILCLFSFCFYDQVVVGISNIYGTSSLWGPVRALSKLPLIFSTFAFMEQTTGRGMGLA